MRAAAALALALALAAPGVSVARESSGAGPARLPANNERAAAAREGRAGPLTLGTIHLHGQPGHLAKPALGTWPAHEAFRSTKPPVFRPARPVFSTMGRL